MNPISKVPGVITRPARTAGAVAGATLGVGLRTTARVLGWAVQRVVPSPERSSPAMPEEAPEAPAPEAAATAPAETAPAPADEAADAPAKKTTAKKAPVKKAPVKKAPSRKAAVMAPALGLTEAEVEAQLEPEPEPESGSGAESEVDTPTDEPLLDPATAKAVASEAETMQRAADPDKG